MLLLTVGYDFSTETSATMITLNLTWRTSPTSFLSHTTVLAIKSRKERLEVGNSHAVNPLISLDQLKGLPTKVKKNRGDQQSGDPNRIHLDVSRVTGQMEDTHGKSDNTRNQEGANPDRINVISPVSTYNKFASDEKGGNRFDDYRKRFKQERKNNPSNL